jgi:hypothetical protein
LPCKIYKCQKNKEKTYSRRQDDVNLVLLEHTGDLSSRLCRILFSTATVVGIVKIGRAAGNTFSRHLAEPIKGKNDVFYATIRNFWRVLINSFVNACLFENAVFNP